MRRGTALVMPFNKRRKIGVAPQALLVAACAAAALMVVIFLLASPAGGPSDADRPEAGAGISKQPPGQTGSAAAAGAIPGTGGGPYVVTSFGARGDGKTDDTAAIQAAVDKAGAGGGGIVKLPAGVYLVSGTIVLAKNNVTLEGDGWGAVLKMTKHPKRVVELRGGAHNGVRNLQIALGVKGGARDDADEGVYVSSRATDFRIEKVFGNGKGIMVRGGATNGVIRDNRIQDTLADGIHITGGSSDILVENNELSRTGDDAIAVVSYRSQGALCEGITIRRNVVRDSAARGIAFVGGDGADIMDNDVAGTSSSGILAAQDSTYDTYPAAHARIEGNRVADAGRYGPVRGNPFGVEVGEGTTGVILMDNEVSDSLGRGISVVAPETTIHGNRVSGSGGSGLDLQADGCVVTDNRFEDNGEYGLVATRSDRLIVWGNTMTNNNAAGKPGIDNFHLEDCDDATVSHNVSQETRATMRVESDYETRGSCARLIFEQNESAGAQRAELMGCRQ